MKKKKTCVITGGGSGGHIAPVRAVAKDLAKSYTLVWIGSSSFERNAAMSLGIPFFRILSGKFRRGKSFTNFIKNFFDVFRVSFALVQSFFLLLRFKPKLIFSTGGFVSVPVVLIAALLRRLIVIHEQTIGFGLANKIGAHFAQKILLAFRDSQKYIPQKYHHKIELVGNPIREDLRKGSLQGLQEKIDFSFAEEKPLLYITGGGQGSRLINEQVWKLLPGLSEKFYIIHQCGKSGIAEGERYGRDTDGYLAFEFIGDELADIYACADVVLARAGAGTVNELAYFDIPSIFVPLRPVQNDEQTKNAQWFLKEHQGAIIEQKKFSSELLEECLSSFSFDYLRRSLKQEQEDSDATTKILSFLK